MLATTKGLEPQEPILVAVPSEHVLQALWTLDKRPSTAPGFTHHLFNSAVTGLAGLVQVSAHHKMIIK